MRIPVVLVEMLHQGFNNTEIAERLGCAHHTVADARHALGLPNARRRRTPGSLRRLYAEAVPTGQVRTYRPDRPAPRIRWSREEQDAHYAALADAVGAPRERPAGVVAA